MYTNTEKLVRFARASAQAGERDETHNETEETTDRSRHNINKVIIVHWYHERSTPLTTVARHNEG